ncbi:probable alpha,alpha-trehalose-phosphate synthase [UDP-forming] 7 [Cynara cardunculus var. scolymus]|uniref:alpha,alpha-trehalose-phosphate synthase (UDP-forming) n=1 Tax=Cynara cardunculus var. scolymus TaxID=59895 RepID=A0A103XTU4_CYNCS|nr:probable alpha,alpha-trehalose-phosphate synthase [UDP-forming] 7 [Cynara cardunculus var. scolymus]XP_024987549.1 probable alpha,alpha-trehalose-phosphate synthase [UDP-forming] 7 [Cynara cardunculus var. scolymus]XP_024987550.1 probable alpha,alpha-trehalose-phosphate synthase [UDP-forming] 7 [Cynara cardunculus var. scolymus]KVH96785.1 Glycosyl transferase, family 20 [Cynara cardunculus var. scolymus]
MISRSYANLLDLANGNFPAMEEPRRKMFSRTMTVPGVLSELDDDQARSVSSEAPSTVLADRLIVVANQLPIKATRRIDDKGESSWNFCWDENSLYKHIKDGLPEEMEVIYVGSLRADVDPSEQDEVSQILLERFKCVPAFLPAAVLDKYYHGFCKQHLWPLFHYRLPFSATHGGRFDRSLWEAYVAANKIFSQKVIEVINPDDDYVWIHDYHLMVLPTFLRRHFNRLRMGFFLHSPFPSSEIYRTLPVREEILKALLNADLLGFHTFDYARHFLSCCSRMLGLEYQSKRGYIGLEYYGRTIGIKIMPSGIHMGQMESVLRQSDKQSRVRALAQQFEGKTVLLGVDDLDIFKGVNLKVLAMEQMLKSHRSWLGRAVLVQILNPARGKGRQVEEIEAEIRTSSERINQELGSPGYTPIVLVDTPLSLSEKAAYYTISEAAVVTAIRDGMNLTPYEYVVCRQGISGTDISNSPQKSMLVVSEFVGCSPSLSGAIRVNPWNVDATAEAMYEAISTPEVEKQMRHEKHYRYVSSHDVAYWSRSFFQDLERNCADHFRRRCWGIGLSFGFRVVALDPMFRKLTMDAIMDAYGRAQSRAILLDYDGTVMPQSSIDTSPSEEVISIINRLCNDPKNMVFVISGRGKESLGKWFAPCEKLGLAAEHGYFMRWPADKEWETCAQNTNFTWMQMAEPVMRLYTEATDGSYIERKESALVWHHQDADPSFGSAQAKEMLDHLESVLANEPVVVKSGQYIVEVKPQGVTKGLVAEKIFLSMFRNERRADFVLCVGDDRSDEDMFVMIGDAIKAGVILNNKSVFACTVGQKPSKAEYYLDDTVEVINMLENLGDVSDSEEEDDPGSSSS